MSVDAWSVGDDFARVVDTLEPVYLSCSGGVFDSNAVQAWRFSQSRSPVPEVSGLASVVETDWQFHLSPGSEPRVGGQVADASGECAEIVGAQRMSDRSRWRCVTRRLELRPDAFERVIVQRAIWQTTQEGPAITGWEPDTRAVRGVVWRDGHTIATATELPQPRVAAVLSAGSAAVGDRVSAQRSGLIAVTEVVQSDLVGHPDVIVGRVVPEL